MPTTDRWTSCLALLAGITVWLVAHIGSAQECTVETQMIAAVDGWNGDAFGAAVSADGNVMIVGSPASDPNDMTNAGSAYVYRFDGMAFVLEQKLVASDAAPGDSFGHTVAVDGTVAVVGAKRNRMGAAYVFRFNGSSWIEEQQFQGTEFFGWSVAVDDDVIVIGDSTNSQVTSVAGAVFVYQFDGNSWVMQQMLTASDASRDDRLGSTVAIKGDLILASASGEDSMAYDSGAVYVFRHDEGIWTEYQKLKASDAAEHDHYGRSVAIDGDVAVIGASWDDDAGAAAGSAYILRLRDGSWVEEQEVYAENPNPVGHFGTSVAVLDGQVVVGAFGNAYSFVSNGNGWEPRQRFESRDVVPGDHFGSQVAMTPNRIAIGALGDDVVGTDDGAVYLFDAPYEPSCRAGSVNLGMDAPVDVLFVNDDAGTCALREVDVAVGDPIQISMTAPPAGPKEARFCLYAWSGEPEPSANHPQPEGLGTMCFPTFISIGTDKPDLVWNNAGHQALLGTPDYPSTPAPSVVASASVGWPRPTTVTIQGFIIDRGSAAPFSGSVTNAVVIRVRE